MKVLVTGINGFVGKVLSEKLKFEGHDVFGLDLEGDNRSIFSADITDHVSVNGIISKVCPDSIIHLAAVSKVDFKNPSLLYKININGTINVLTAAVNLEKIPEFLFISSSQVYGIVEESNQPVNENMPVCPVNHYGASKAAGENICAAFGYEYGLPLVIARPFNHIGVGQDPHFVVPKIVKAYRERHQHLNLGNIETVRDFLDVRDVADAYINIITEFKGGAVYNISSGTGIKISNIIRKLETLTNCKISITKEDHLMRKNEITISTGASARIRDELGWRPKYSIDDTLKWMLGL